MVNVGVNEFFNTTSSPKGHGFNQSDVAAGFACYSFEPRSDIPIKVIVLAFIAIILVKLFLMKNLEIKSIILVSLI